MSTDRSPAVSRWWFVVLAALAMGAIGTYQFAWSTVRVPLGSRLDASETALGTVFTVYLVCQAVSQFPAGWVRDRYGPRIPLLVGTPLVAVGYGWTAVSGSLASVYVAYALGGVGAGVVYTVAVNTAVKWFDERRGLATGIVTASYSALSFLIIPLLRGQLSENFERTLTVMAAGVAAVALLGAVVFRDPERSANDGSDSAGNESEVDTGDGRDDVETGADAGEDAGTDAGENAGTDDGEDAETNAGADAETGDGEPTVTEGTAGPGGPDLAWHEAVRTWQFWLLYAVFVVVNGVGLMLIGKVVAYAQELALPAAAATAGASAVAAADALGIALIGSLSDRFGRVRTVAASLVLTGVTLAATVPLGTTGAAWPFVAMAGAAAFFRSPPFSVFPSLVGEYYGTSHSSENYALLYTAKIPGSIFGGTVASGLVVSIGWTDSFLVAAGAIALAGVATFALRPPSERSGPAD